MTPVLLQFDDLPDELLVHIFKKLYNIEVLFYLKDVNQRLNRIAHDSVFTNHLSLLTYCAKKNSIDRLPDLVLDQFCSKILPQIGYQIRTFCLEGISMERILHATNYPNLYGLALYDLDVVVATSLFLDQNSVLNIFKNQISLFCISFTNANDSSLRGDVYAFLFTQILTNFINLKCLKFNSDSTHVDEVFFKGSPPYVISSTLLELHVRVACFTDCLYLLDGRFDQLRVFYVEISIVWALPLPIEHKTQLLPNLRIFSLDWTDKLYNFDDLIVPFLLRMINLEELHLNIEVEPDGELIDGNTLKKDITIDKLHLYKFTFNIFSSIHHNDQTIFPSNEYIQKTVQDFYDNQIITCVDHFHEAGFSQCHIYTYPYQLKFYDHITNNFPGGIFNSVTEVSLYDERPFEYDFFVRIAQSFPFLDVLTINNRQPQNNKQLMELNNDNQLSSIIRYYNLTRLDLFKSHDDYIELFLLDTKISLSNDVCLLVNYEPLERVTHNFTRDQTRNNCEKLRSLVLGWREPVNERIKHYFPYTNLD